MMDLELDGSDDASFTIKKFKRMKLSDDETDSNSSLATAHEAKEDHDDFANTQLMVSVFEASTRAMSSQSQLFHVGSTTAPTFNHMISLTLKQSKQTIETQPGTEAYFCYGSRKRLQPLPKSTFSSN